MIIYMWSCGYTQVQLINNAYDQSYQGTILILIFDFFQKISNLIQNMLFEGLNISALHLYIWSHKSNKKWSESSWDSSDEWCVI